ncbi:MAG: photosystem II reaction center PsbP [Cyanobacteria bacterium P01_H01_bin.119]
MLNRVAAVLLVIAALALQSCGGGAVSLQSYADNYDGYKFQYPTGWVEVSIPGQGPDVVFHDFVNETENVSVVISDVPEGTTLKDLGTPTEVGYKLSKSINAMTGDDRDVELVNAQAFPVEDKLYYILEYVADLPAGVRHNLASVIVRRGKLYTFNASTRESRWERVKTMFKQSVASFTVY